MRDKFDILDASRRRDCFGASSKQLIFEFHVCKVQVVPRSMLC